MSGTRLAAGDLIDAARERTGLSDFGDGSFREGLDVLVATINENPYHAEGRRKAASSLRGLLTNRLRVNEALRRHPEIRERELRAPMFLTGLPRSGTSALFNLLAADSDARPLLLWETRFPDPCWDIERGQPDPRREAMVRGIEKTRAEHPEMAAIHYVDADQPEECVLLASLSFSTPYSGFEFALEPYSSWLRTHDLRPTYRYYADTLRLLDWQRPGTRWLLKTPFHLWALDVLDEVFPGCRIVWNHRDPATCMASIASMTRAFLGQSVETPPADLGARVVDFFGASLERGLEDRQNLAPRRIVDVDYTALVTDPLRQVDQIYERFDIERSAAARAAMTEHVEANTKDRHGKHRYSLEEFDISPNEIQERFRTYRERFGIQQESA